MNVPETRVSDLRSIKVHGFGGPTSAVSCELGTYSYTAMVDIHEVVYRWNDRKVVR